MSDSQASIGWQGNEHLVTPICAPGSWGGGGARMKQARAISGQRWSASAHCGLLLRHRARLAKPLLSAYFRPISLMAQCDQADKRRRTTFNVVQIEVMENEFSAKKYLSLIERERLANRLNLTETQVKVWFQNQRSKWKKCKLKAAQRGSGQQWPTTVVVPIPVYANRIRVKNHEDAEKKRLLKVQTGPFAAPHDAEPCA